MTIGFTRISKPPATTGLGEELLGALRDHRAGSSTPRCSPCGRDSSSTSTASRALALPQAADDRLLVHREVEGQPHLARVLQALRILRDRRPRGRSGSSPLGPAWSGRQDHPVLRGVGILVDAQGRLLRLLEVVAEDLGDVDLAGAHARQPGRGLGDAADEQLLERGRLSPVARHRLESVIVALLALDVAIGPGADGWIAAFCSPTDSTYFFGTTFW